MYLQQLKNIIYEKGFRRADIARMTGVSRATVTLWFQREKEGWVNIESSTLLKLAQSLNVPPEIFLQKRENLFPLQTRFLWDHLYSSMESFVEALSQKRLPALARLIQVLGFAESKNVVGSVIINFFDNYKKFIKTVRRKELERLWPLYHLKK